MSIHSGSFSLSRYRLVGKAGRLNLQKLSEGLEPQKARPFKLRASKLDNVYGWVRPYTHDEDEDLDLEAHWDMSDCQAAEGFLLRFRVEKRKVPSQLMQLMVKEKTQAALKRRKDRGLARAERREITDGVKEELLERALPTIHYVDAFWDTDKNEVFLFSTGKQNSAIFEELFRKSFSEPMGLSLLPLASPLLGLSEHEWDAETAETRRLEKMSLVMPMHLVGHESVITGA